MSWKLPDNWQETVGPVKPRGEFRGFGLPLRLEAVAACVGIGARVADIGTDHGLLPCALVGSGRASFAIAADLRPEPLSGAELNVRRFGSSEKVELRLGDGLNVLGPMEVDTVTVAGMSGGRMADMLLACDLERLGVSRIILQPNSQRIELRDRMAGAGWEVVYERMVACGQRCYVVIVFEATTGESIELSREDAILGPFLKKTPSEPVYKIWRSLMTALLQKKVRGLEQGECDEMQLLEARQELAIFTTSPEIENS